MIIVATLPTPLGHFTLTADALGLCGVSFPTETASDTGTPTVAIADHPILRKAGQQLLAYFDGSLRDFDLPLSIQGTVFQRLVWTELQTIPYGQTMTYGQLAERIGGRHKARAVGGAAHANPLGIIIPCHRLIGAGGKLTGFGGGLAMKQALLDLEQQTGARKKNDA